ncbi:rRNA-processing protein UTP23 [Pseudozyma hubeiensis]|nr:rRNA-processing protein UTP23 [Pseudozyma hubeiensis]
MRQRRAKIYRKMLHAYSLQFGFREPYQLLIDDTFSLALTRYKISNPLQQFGNVLQSKKIKPLITQCCMQALYALGKEAQSTVDMAKQWERRMCNHREAIDPQRCIKECVGENNKHRYMVASEQGELRRDLRLAVAGVPMMHFTQAVMVLEPMSPLTKSKIEEREEEKLSLPASEAGLLKNQPKVDVDIVGADEDAEEGDKTEGAEGEAKEESSSRRRKRKAPNPLSVRKSKNPKLSMEDKLKREQELKKQKQRAAARARFEATKPSADKGEGSPDADGARKKRRRQNGNKSGSVGASESTKESSVAKDGIKLQTEVQATVGGANGESKNRRKRGRSSNAANGAKPDQPSSEPISA